jgi:UDP-N-acetylmuramate--alanine ligase
LKLVPDVAVITSMDPDHLDIYGTPAAVEDAFVQFSQKVKPGGCLISKYGLSRAGELNAAHQYSYDYKNPAAAVHAENITTHNGSYGFDAVSDEWTVTGIELHMGGLHNIENAIAAITVAKYLSISDDQIRAAIADFKGVRRRFEYILKNEDHILIDDYAHHPEELRALISGVRSLFADRKLVLVFQPHLFSRTNDLADEFAESLDLADEVILLPIYPARELPIEGVTSEMLLKRMKITHKQILEKPALLEYIAKQQPALVVMAGAGDIDALVLPVKELLK